MSVRPRAVLERAELVTLVFLVVATPLLEILDVLGVFRTDLGATLLVLLIANIAAVLLTMEARVLTIDENVRIVQQTVRHEVLRHREQMFIEIIDRLIALTVDRRHVPVRLYAPAGAWITDASYRWWYGHLADLVRDDRIVLIAAYGLTTSRSDFDRLRSVIVDGFGALDQRWCVEGTEKGALFHLFPPSPPRPGFGIVLAGQELAILDFPVTPGYRGAERGIVINGEEPIGALITWFDNHVRPHAQPLNVAECLADGFKTFEERYFAEQAA